MKEKLIAGICMLVLFVSILGLSGCGSGSGAAAAPTGEGITVVRPSAAAAIDSGFAAAIDWVAARFFSL